MDLTLVDLTELLPSLGAPCVAEGLTRDGAAQVSRSARRCCPAAKAQPLLCAYWRECLHGLVSGLSSSVYYTRVESPRLGGDRCGDLLHVDAQSLLRFQPVPAEMEAVLAEAAARLVRIAPKATVAFLGLVDGALHLRITNDGSHCGPDLNVVLQHTLHRSFPELEIHDATPRAVLTESS